MPGHRHQRSGSLNIASQDGNPNGIMTSMAGGQRFEGPRSPPSELSPSPREFRPAPALSRPPRRPPPRVGGPPPSPPPELSRAAREGKAPRKAGRRRRARGDAPRGRPRHPVASRTANDVARPDTSHVPCKFFRQGTCQAGNTCPFSHDVAQETVCKYFAKVRGARPPLVAP